MNNYQMFRKIQEQAKQYKKYDNFDREDLIDELIEEKRINEANLDEINKYKEVLDKIKEKLNILNEEPYNATTYIMVITEIYKLLEEIE